MEQHTTTSRGLLASLPLLLALLPGAPAWAADQPSVDFGCEASREVSNDLMSAQLSVELTERDPGRVASRLSGTLDSGLRLARTFPSVSVSSGNQFTLPVYGKNGQLTGWRGHADLRLESKDFQATAQLIAQLQDSLQLTGISFSLAPATRQLARDGLIVEAMEAFRKRAKVVTGAMSAQGYTVRHLVIDDGGNLGVMPMSLLRSAADAGLPAPEFAAGTTPVTVRVSGTIEIR
jgi:predicted secreted protein